MAVAFKVSFSVAKAVTGREPFQSKVEARIASAKSPFGSQSVHCRWPWKPPEIAFLPRASSSQPISAKRGFPKRISRIIKVCLAINSQSLSAGITLDLVITSGNSFPALMSTPSLQYSLIQARAFSYSSLS